MTKYFGKYKCRVIGNDSKGFSHIKYNAISYLTGNVVYMDEWVPATTLTNTPRTFDKEDSK